ncbi:hypothetical protein SBOR_3545 [Sclerotinia borealis F-4128]|uniref:Uncharacterized protein n=1 Tax=Sclerotinia borealis (strain F-4128) TaxID=1432307 RepID=W9CJ81_SCLBF|nr:hypothetical protein SBOR_3545 [Sclerotinia borealis F-4128]
MSYIRSPHYQRHYQSMVLNLCSIYPHFETDSFDRAYHAELASAISKNPTTGMDFCYYWTDKIMWQKFKYYDAYGEFPGRYSGPEYITQEQIRVNPISPTPQTAQQVPGTDPDFVEETLKTPSWPDTRPAQQTLEQAPEVSELQRTPASQSVQQQVDLIAMQPVKHHDQQSEGLAQNHFEKPQDPPASVPVPTSQKQAPELFGRKDSPNPEAIKQSPNFASEFDSQSSKPSPLLAAWLALSKASNPNSAPTLTPSATNAPLPPLLLPDLLIKDPTTGEVMTVETFERRCIRRGADIAVKHVKTAIDETARISKAKLHGMLDKALTTIDQ